MTIDELIAAFEQIEGVTPGPWEVVIPDRGYLDNYVVTLHQDHAPDGKNKWKHIVTNCDTQRGEIDASHIALCSPENIAMIIARMRELEEALKPFAKSADGFDSHRNISDPAQWYAYGGVTTADGNVGAITVADLRRARAAIGKE